MAAQPSDEELLSLLAQMTLNEKISMLGGRNFWETVPIERLNIPSLKVSDGPNGARGADFFHGTTAACFPASVSLAATFNHELAQRIGVALGQETQTKGAYVLLGPTVCPHRSPLGGRNFESFSEDPVLAGELASAYVLGLQSERVGATVKHFVANEQETRRFSVDETVSDRALREIYLRPFEIIVKKADPWCVMTSYNKVNGKYIDNQSTFVKDILRNEWGFNGLVMTDWGSASDAVAAGIHNGVDLEMPGPPARRTLQAVQKLVASGDVDVKEIDARILTLLKLLRRTGKFTDRKESVPEQAIRRPEHDQLIREAGAEGIVLLKNAGDILPLKKDSLKKIAILGPLAKRASAHGGGSASLNSHYTVNPLDALTDRLERLGGAELTYSQGAHIFRAYPSLAAGLSTRHNKPGFTGDFFKTLDMSDEPFHTETYPAGMFMNVMKPKVAGAKAGRFTAKYVPEATGKHYLSFAGGGPTKLFINGELVGEAGPVKDIATFFFGCEEGYKVRYDFKAGEAYDIVLDTLVSPVANSDLDIFGDQICGYFGFVSEQEMDADLLSEAVELAKQADVAICFVGNTPQWETEGVDMASMSLPANGSQDKLVAEVCSVNPNTIVVLTTGAAVELPWLDQTSAVLQAFYAGQETGNAIVDVLLGDANPGGRLPFSWPKKYEHTGCYGHFGLDSFESRKVEYVEGVNVGYRHFDTLYGTDREVLFPFGYGLSYTSFSVSGAQLSGSLREDDPNATISVTVAVRNTGAKAGSQVIQVYLAPPQRGIPSGRPAKSLAAFGKVHLAPGEQRDLHLSFKRDAAAFWAEDIGVWRVESGEHKVLVSTSSHPADVKAELSLDVANSFHFKA